MTPDSHAPPRAASRLSFADVAAYVVASAVALLAAFAIDLRSGLRVHGGELALDGRQTLAALGHSLALVAPIVLASAIVLVALDLFAREPMERVRRLFSLRTFFRPDPEAIAQATSFLVGLALATTGIFRAVTRALIAFHAPTVIAVVIACVAPAFVYLGIFVARRIERPLTRFAFGLDEAASPALLVTVLGIGVISYCYRLAETAPDLDRAIPWPSLRIVATFLLTLLIASSTLRDRARSSRVVRPLGVATLLVIAFGTTTSIATYGRSTSQRTFVEDVTWSSSIAYRAWSELLDRDGDGYPALLGGRDCDDTRSGIHPGTFDSPGDHVDADCFGGDGTPPFDDRRLDPPSAPLLPNGAPPNIVIVSIDTMRPDRLGVLGNTRHLTPNLDRLARDAVVFDQVESSSPRTTRSIPAIFTGQHPGRLPFQRSLNHLDLDPSVETLSEHMADRYETAAILGTSYFQTVPNLVQGFARVEQSTTMKPNPRFATDLAIQWLTAGRATQKPFLLWVHYFQPHEPYLFDGTPSRFGPRPQDHYDTEVQRADVEVGRLIDHLRARGIDSNTVVIVISDHGESLGEHGAYGHSTRLTEDQLRSVFMIRAPGIPGRIERTPIALFDLYSTVLDLAGIRPAGAVSSRSLLPLMRGSTTGFVNRPLFAEILPDAVYSIETQSVRRGNDKLIFFPRTGRLSLFDLGTDPNELRDLADAHPARARELRQLLLAWDGSSHRPENHVSEVIHDSRVARLPPDATRLDARFTNGITLVGARLREPRVPKNGVLVADLYFRAERPITSDYYIHFTYEPADAGGTALEAHHTALEGSFPTTLWRPGEMFRDTVTLRVPPQARTDTYYIGQVELWSHFHVRNAVPAEISGITRESIRFGRVEIY